MVTPFLIQLHQLVKFLLKIVRGRLGALLRVAVKGGVFRGWGGLRRLGHFIGIAFRLFAHFGVRRCHFLENGILLQLLFNERLEFERRRLEQCE